MDSSRTIISVLSLLFLSLSSACADENGTTEEFPDAPATASARYPDRETEPEPAPYDDVVELEVRNQTARAVYKLYVSPSTSEQWGPDLLKGKLLNTGASALFQNEYCDAYYDLKALDILGGTIARANRIYFDCGKREIITLL